MNFYGFSVQRETLIHRLHCLLSNSLQNWKHVPRQTLWPDKFICVLELLPQKLCSNCFRKSSRTFQQNKFTKYIKYYCENYSTYHKSNNLNERIVRVLECTAHHFLQQFDLKEINECIYCYDKRLAARSWLPRKGTAAVVSSRMNVWH